MRIKSYFANSVEAAIRQASHDLGPEAMLIESRPASAEGRHLGRYEVVFGTREQPAKDTAAAAPSSRDDLASELKALRGQMDELRRMLQPSQPAAPVKSELEEIREELMAADIDPAVVENLVETAYSIWKSPVAQAPRSGAAGDFLRQIIGECIRRRLQGPPPLAAPVTTRGNVIILVGPPGSGKTTSLAKIALQHCLAQHRSVRIISVDTERVGGHERLRAFSAILGASFTAANSTGELSEALTDARSKDFVLVDTPGYSGADLDSATEIAAALGKTDTREVHLVLPASMKRLDLSAASERFAIFKPDRLLFTKLDETTSFGSVLSEALRIGKPLSFFSTGQSVPEDLEVASVDTIMAKLFRPQAATAAVSAA